MGLSVHTLTGKSNAKDRILSPLGKYNDGEKQQTLLGHQETVHNSSGRTRNECKEGFSEEVLLELSFKEMSRILPSKE